MKTWGMSEKEVSLVDLDSSMKSILGGMCWGVRYGLDNLSMEIGEPYLKVIHEPVPSVQSVHEGKELSKENVSRLNNRRLIAVSGQWHLWVYYAYWKIVRAGTSLASTSSTQKKIYSAIRELEGQRLVNGFVNPVNGATRFEFDLDTTLYVRRAERASEHEIWLMFGRDGFDRSVWGDGKFKREECGL